MGASVEVFLFGKPEMMLGGGDAPVTPADVASLGEELRQRLLRASEVMALLEKDGWLGDLCLYDMDYTHPDVGTAEEAVRRLRALGVDPDEVTVVEDGDEWDGHDGGFGGEEEVVG
jgi:hypothetical protein